jgi:predicted lipoprotein with Yx(FWY)xxD motif
VTRSRLAIVAPMALAAAIVAGCGSSSSSSTSSTSAATSTSTSAAATSSTTTAAPAPAPSSAVAITAKQSKLGTILAAGPKKLTVYLFQGDKGASSSCSGACAMAWPPVTTSGAASATGQAVAADLGTIKRADGTTQVTYKGHPLYFFVKDGDSGDAYGQGAKAFGADWYVLAPSGNKIDKS